MNLLSVKGVNGNYGGEAYRTGELCKVCGNIIQRIKLGGRSSQFCSQFQS